MAISYKIDDKLTITFDVNDAPVVQPTWPDGTPFKDKAEAEKWAKTFVGYLKDETAPQPGNSPDKPTLTDDDLIDHEAVERLKKETEEQAKIDAEKAAKFEEELALAEAGTLYTEPPQFLIELAGDPESKEDIIDAEIVDEK